MRRKQKSISETLHSDQHNTHSHQNHHYLVYLLEASPKYTFLQSTSTERKKKKKFLKLQNRRGEKRLNDYFVRHKILHIKIVHTSSVQRSQVWSFCNSSSWLVVNYVQMAWFMASFTFWWHELFQEICTHDFCTEKTGNRNNHHLVCTRLVLWYKPRHFKGTLRKICEE